MSSPIRIPSSPEAESSSEPSADRGPEARGGRDRPRVTLRAVAEHLGLSPATVSLVLNRSRRADAIPDETHRRVFAAARELGYRPNLVARSLRGQRSFLIGVLVPEISEGYVSGVMLGVLGGLERHLAEQGYSCLIASHQSRPDLLETRLGQLRDRWVEGLIVVGTRLAAPPELPTVVVSGRDRLPGVTNVGVDNHLAARLALAHLAELGHQRISFLRGPVESVDADDRWRGIVEAAADLGLEIRPELSPRLAGSSHGPEPALDAGYRQGYACGEELLAAGRLPDPDGAEDGELGFTAVFAFNDVSAIGAMRAFQHAGLRVPEDVSVIGIDDVEGAAFQNPPLTTIRQPLAEIGATAGSILARRLAGQDPPPESVAVKPELVVRGSTGRVPRLPTEASGVMVRRGPR